MSISSPKVRFDHDSLAAGETLLKLVKAIKFKFEMIDVEMLITQDKVNLLRPLFLLTRRFFNTKLTKRS